MTKILLIEDDVFLLKMYRKKFQVAGYDVDTAQNGKDGLEKVPAYKPDLIVMDIMMPKLDGLAALDRLKADESTKHIPVLILTNLSSTEDAQTAVTKGAVGYLVKSNLTPDEIVDKIKTII